MVYLDNAATTPLNNAAISAMTHVMTETFGNPSSLHAYGRQASKELRESREEMANQFDVPARKLIFTSGGTEGNNTAIKGYALANQAKGKHLITTAIEHHSVLHTMAYLEERFGFEVTYILWAKNTLGRIFLRRTKKLSPLRLLPSFPSSSPERGSFFVICHIFLRSSIDSCNII